jgi:hypothetical protein
VTDVLAGVDSFLDDALSTAETKPQAAKPEPKSTKCRYCTETFEGQWGSARRGMHEKKVHPDEWTRAKAGVKPAKKVAKKAPAAKKPITGPVTQAKGRRIPAAESIGRNLGRLGKLVGNVDGPLGRAIAFSAPATGDAVDELVAGTVVDRVVIQRFAGAADKWEKFGGVVAFPVLIALVSRNPQLFIPLEDDLREATLDVIIASIPTFEKQAAKERKAVDALARLKKVDERYANSDDPIKLILEDIFGVHIVSPEDLGTNGEAQ